MFFKYNSISSNHSSVVSMIGLWGEIPNVTRGEIDKSPINPWEAIKAPEHGNNRPAQ